MNLILVTGYVARLLENTSVVRHLASAHPHLLSEAARSCDSGLMLPSPPQFDGTFSEFFSRYIEPNLPSADRVAAFDELLRRHLADRNPIHVLRWVRGQTRGEVCQTVNGDRILPTDNAPVWWLHTFLLSEAPLPANPGAMFSTMPAHFYKVARFQTLNQAGFHAAHILSAKNRDIRFRSWSRNELARRMMVNIHPCNMFLVAKQDWTSNGGRPDIIAWVVDAYRARYGLIMDRFLAEFDPDGSFGEPIGNPAYSYAAAASRLGNVIQTKRPVIRQSLVDGGVIHSRRPIIKRDLVGQGVSLEISVGGSRYLLPHDDLVSWAQEYTTALNSASWTDRGLYSWPRTSAAMLQFLRVYQLPS